jgi:hypothetical protein
MTAGRLADFCSFDSSKPGEHPVTGPQYCGPAMKVLWTRRNRHFKNPPRETPVKVAAPFVQEIWPASLWRSFLQLLELPIWCLGANKGPICT